MIFSTNANFWSFLSYSRPAKIHCLGWFNFAVGLSNKYCENSFAFWQDNFSYGDLVCCRFVCSGLVVSQERLVILDLSFLFASHRLFSRQSDSRRFLRPLKDIPSFSQLLEKVRNRFLLLFYRIFPKSFLFSLQIQ